MTAQELQKRNERAQKLRVIQVDDSAFYVESSEGKICYKVTYEDGEVSCTCGDFARNSKTDPNFRCKHMLAVQSCVPNGEFETAQFLEKKRPKLDERFITKIEGREFVTYPGLLDLAHQQGILKIEVDPLQYPTKENSQFAICRAVVVSKTGEIFSDVGDASPENCNSRVSKHLLRMASTRAIARALRSMTNIGMTCLEELADFTDVIGGNDRLGSKTETKKTTRRAPAKKQEKAPVKSKKENASEPDKGKAENQKQVPEKKEAEEKETQVPMMSEAQKRAVYNLSRRRGISVDELEKMARERYSAPLEELSSKDASEFIRSLQQAA
jgi:hypothetical protein